VGGMATMVRSTVVKTDSVLHWEEMNLAYIYHSSTLALKRDVNYNNNYHEISYPFSKIIKLKHEPETAQENKPVQYTAEIIVEIKIEMVQWYP
jgi:hypothetical protein